MEIDLRDNNRCFVCGKDNPEGLKVHFIIDRANRSIKGEFMPESIYQGFQDIIHGGIIATLLDEAMVKLAFEMGIHAVTAWMEIRYLKPLKVGEKLYIHATFTREEKKLIESEARAETGDGTIIAKAAGKLMRIEVKPR